jgi:hypothetical protein
MLCIVNLIVMVFSNIRNIMSLLTRGELESMNVIEKKRIEGRNIF